MRRLSALWVLGAILCGTSATWIVKAAAPPRAPANRASSTALTVDHRQVGCIVAGQHPLLDACFAPTDRLARARVYFRAGGTPHWYFVEMLPAATCFSATLLKPKKSMVGQKVDLYVEGIAKDLQSARTPDYAARVVAAKNECRAELPVAGWIPKAQVSVSGPAGASAVPAGFASSGLVGASGGLSGGTVALGALGAAALAGGAVVLSSGSTSAPPPVVLTPTPTPTPVITPTPTPIPFKPAFRVVPDPPTGPWPLEVLFDMCASTGISLTYRIESDVTRGGAETVGPCQASFAYAADCYRPPNGGPLICSKKEYSYRLTVTDNGQTPPQSATRDGVVVAEPTP